MAASSRERRLKVALVQMSPREAPAENLRRALGYVRQAASQGAKLVCLPELCCYRYFCQSENIDNFAFAETVPGPTTDAFHALAEELNVTIVAGVFERRGPGVFHNTAVVLDGDRGYVGKYRKMHIPDDPRYYEKFYFTPGDLGFRNFSTRAGELGVLICWDQWYPEAARLAALGGAEVLIYPTAIGWHPEEKQELGERQLRAWETVQVGHGISNGCFVLAVNRVGFEPQPDGDGGIEFWGQSFVAAPDGRILARGGVDEEALITVELDLEEVEAFRLGWPFLRDRRIDAYDDLTRRYLDPPSRSRMRPR